MRALPAFGLAACALLAGAQAGSGAPVQVGFAYGVAAGEVTASSALLWTRAPRAGAVTLELLDSAGARVAAAIRPRRLVAGPAADLTVQATVGRLRPGTRYRYRFRQGGAVSATGTFETAPAATASVPVRFAISGDADATPRADGTLAFNRFGVYARMAAEGNDFNVNLGDTIYSDSAVGGAPVARTVAAKWAKYRLGLALPALRRLRAATGLYSHWDDHEFVNDFSRPEHGEAIYRAGVKAFRDYAPVAYSSRLGLYRSVRWGRHLELFFLDERSFRDAKATAACAGDLAPTLPQPVRDAFATLAPGLRTPPSAACLAAVSDPARTLLGAAQYAVFTRAVAGSTATWKVIVNEVPIQQYYALPYDRWEGYAVERERLLRFLQARVRNVVFLTTDTHANLVNEVRYRTVGGPLEGTGIWEVVTGPVATNTFAKEIDRFLGTPGAGTAIGSLFFKPPPPQGLGMRCAALDVYSYAQVTVTARTLTVALRDARGRPVREATGEPCAPLVLRAR
ncbi:MAG TPA: alkaline phosphatase D family protein [Gaiellaceae bacterium]|nr:alkaline phosphatase D family protein [Gaiellaceae bacterium]